MTKNERIEKLERRVMELEARVAVLEVRPSLIHPLITAPERNIYSPWYLPLVSSTDTSYSV